MTASAEIFSALTGYAGVQALVNNSDSPQTYRVYPLLMPQDSTRPVVTYRIVSGQRQVPIYSTGSPQVQNLRVRIDAWSETLTQAESLAEECRKALENASAFSTVPVIEPIHDYESDTKLYRVMADYSIWYHS